MQPPVELTSPTPGFGGAAEDCQDASHNAFNSSDDDEPVLRHSAPPAVDTEELALALRLGMRTGTTHVIHIFTKPGIDSRTGAVVHAIRPGPA